MHILNKKYKLDYYFVFGDYYKKFVQNKISCNVISTGSIIANSLDLIKIDLISKIQFISSWSANHLDINYKDGGKNEFFLATKFLILILEEFSKNNNIQIEVILRTNYLEEKNFYRNIQKNIKKTFLYY